MTGSISATADLPSALEQTTAIASRLRSATPVVFSDYDGTLTPIVAKPEFAVLDNEMRDTLAELANCCPLGIISGRALSDLQQLVDLNTVYYAGNHGLEVAGPKGSGITATHGEEYVADLAAVRQQLCEQLAAVSGVLVEDKHLSLSVHFRLADPGDSAHIEQVVDQVLASQPTLRKHYGKKVFEVRPALHWHKGRVVDWLLELLAIDPVLPIYLGDDVTDEDAFLAVQSRGIGIRIGSDRADSCAHYSLRNPEEVRQFLFWLQHQLCGGG